MRNRRRLRLANEIRSIQRRACVVSHEVDPSNIEVNRRARRAKTNRIDLARIMRAFLAHLRGEPLACSIVHVPSPEGEDNKRPSRERERLIKERTSHTGQA